MGSRQPEVSNLVFYTQSTNTVISGWATWGARGKLHLFLWESCLALFYWEKEIQSRRCSLHVLKRCVCEKAAWHCFIEKCAWHCFMKTISSPIDVIYSHWRSVRACVRGRARARACVCVCVHARAPACVTTCRAAVHAWVSCLYGRIFLRHCEYRWEKIWKTGRMTDRYSNSVLSCFIFRKRNVVLWEKKKKKKIPKCRPPVNVDSLLSAVSWSNLPQHVCTLKGAFYWLLELLLAEVTAEVNLFFSFFLFFKLFVYSWSGFRQRSQ